MEKITLYIYQNNYSDTTNSPKSPQRLPEHIPATIPTSSAPFANFMQGAIGPSIFGHASIHPQIPHFPYGRPNINFLPKAGYTK